MHDRVQNDQGSELSEEAAISLHTWIARIKPMINVRQLRFREKLWAMTSKVWTAHRLPCGCGYRPHSIHSFPDSTVTTTNFGPVSGHGKYCCRCFHQIETYSDISSWHPARYSEELTLTAGWHGAKMIRIFCGVCKVPHI